ncbi:MAG TPA: hypothetical protein VLW45_00245 [Pelomicrobium sp.]|nr:hypothetical protein [Pelomicrobium sp.]
MQADDTFKRRQIVFHPVPAGQAQRAGALLGRVKGLAVRCDADAASLSVEYHVPDFTLAGIEEALEAYGFHLDGSLLQRLRRAVVHYAEEVQCENLSMPERCEKCREIWVQAFEHHPHGDRDETPEEWRAYR